MADLAQSAVAAGLPPSRALEVAEAVRLAEANQEARRAALLPEYDYIVCGAGSSGSVVARRLAEASSATVLLLEAGPSDAQARVFELFEWYAAMRDLDWGYRAEPNPAMNGRAIALSMGRVVGGGSSVNAMIWARGHRLDYEGWAAAAKDPRWGYDHVLSIYRRIEDWQGAPDPGRRGRGGLVWIEPARDPSPLALATLEAAAAIGIEVAADHNGAMMEGGPGGGGLANLSTRNGLRLNVPAHYLHPVLHLPNLTVLPMARVLRVLLDGKRATGVEIELAGERRRIGASTEIVLAMGAFQTPHVLMLSGIGDPAELAPVGIPVLHHLPGVGRNFQDHLLVGSCIWQADEPIRRSANYNEATFFLKSRPDLPVPDLQPFLFTRPHASDVHRERIAVDERAWAIGPGLIHSATRGRLHLRSARPEDLVRVEANLLDTADRAALRAGIAQVRALTAAPPLARFARRELLPGPHYGDDLDGFISNGAHSYGHPTCTCPMGHDDAAVVDNELRVHGLTGLRIADGSIMPTITTGNTMAPCVIIGERMAEILAAG